MKAAPSTCTERLFGVALTAANLFLGELADQAVVDGVLVEVLAQLIFGVHSEVTSPLRLSGRGSSEHR